MKQFTNDGTISMENNNFFVLDEADRMLDMGFQDDIYFFARAPGMPPKEQRQALLFRFNPRTETYFLKLRSNFI